MLPLPLITPSIPLYPQKAKTMSKPKTPKAQSILTREDLGSPHNNLVCFQQIDEETFLISRSVLMPQELFEDLGSPDKITLTIQPGDLLNPPKGPHSRACGIRQHDHGLACHRNCPTCGGEERMAP